MAEVPTRPQTRVWVNAPARHRGKSAPARRRGRGVVETKDALHGTAVRGKRVAAKNRWGNAAGKCGGAGKGRRDRNFPCQTLKIRKVSLVIMGS
jgi:hypothetical protein